MILMATLSRLTPEEAHLLQGRLEAEQVPAAIREDHSAGLPVAGGSLAGARLEVPDEHAGRAGEVLREVQESTAPRQAEGESEIPRPDPARIGTIRVGLILELVLYVLFLAAILFRFFAS
jgi:hypothetical protein